MPYTNWEDISPLLSSLYWYSVQDLVKYLHDLKRYIIRTPAKFSETHAPKLPEKAAPAKRHERFPGRGSYLCEGIGNWNVELNLLELSAYVMINQNRITRDYPSYKTPGEAEVYAITKINQLLQIIHQNQVQEDYHQAPITFGQQEFEEYYGLIWVDQDEKEEEDHQANEKVK